MQGIQAESVFKVLSKQDGEFEIVATTNDVDRMDEIVEPKGVTNLDRYLKDNPVVLYGHDWGGMPIGKATSGGLIDSADGHQELRLTVRFADTDMGREVRSLYDGGFLNAFSIGFMPRVTGTDEQGRKHYKSWDLLEVSAVPIPANDRALVMRTMENRGIKLDALRKAWSADDQAKPGAAALKVDEASSLLRVAEAYQKHSERKST